MMTQLSTFKKEALAAGIKLSEERKVLLTRLVDYARETLEEGQIPKLTFICTHNSRRSHFGQVWAKIAAQHFGVNIDTFSGGTEATALNPRAAAAMERAGCTLQHAGGENPRYLIAYADGEEPILAFSKVYDDPVNPTRNFAAVMTCSEADEACPVIIGADKRIPLLYEDPKSADGTDRESEVYDERCLQIAVEMFWAMSQIHKS